MRICTLRANLGSYVARLLRDHLFDRFYNRRYLEFGVPSFASSSLDKVTALCVGATAVGFGINMPTGSIEASVAAAGLIGFVVGRSEKFGPECKRVRAKIQESIRKGYDYILTGSDGTSAARLELEIIDKKLDSYLDKCFLDREALVAAAITKRGFVDEGTAIILASINKIEPGIFGDNKFIRWRHEETITERFASDVIKAGLKSAISNLEYYKNIEPILSIEMARYIGTIDENVKEIRKIVELTRNEYDVKLEELANRLHASESSIIALVSFILERGVSPEGLGKDVEQAYAKLKEWRDNYNNRMVCCNYCLDTDGHLFSILRYCKIGRQDGEFIDEGGFFLKSAVAALRTAENTFPGVILGGERSTVHT